MCLTLDITQLRYSSISSVIIECVSNSKEHAISSESKNSAKREKEKRRKGRYK